MSNSKVAVVGTELLKTVGGVMVGRYAVVMGRKALKVDQEADPKKKKIKEIGIALGVTAAGAFGAIKAPNQYKSICAGIATAGALSAMTPFAKEDSGFIPALHGALGTATIEDEEDERIVRELNSPMDYDDVVIEEEEDDSYFDRGVRGLTEDAEYAEMGDELN